MAFLKENINTVNMINIKKIIAALFIIFLCIINNIDIISANETNANYKIRKGTFVKVIVPIEFSTLTSDIEDEIWFINSQDMYIYETKVIPENTKFYGEIEDLREPVQGRDGAIKIKINKMITPDKRVYKIKGHIYSDNDNYLGGKQTSTVYYRKVPHYSQRLKPFLQAAPLNVLEMGRHTVIKPGAELFLIIEEDIEVK